MPVDYSLGKIYKIVGNGKVYVGSTTRPLLSQRLAKHKSDYKYYVNGKVDRYITSCECISDPKCYIELLELCPCSCKDELLKCEGKWIKDLECVNRCVAGQTKKEHYEVHKEEILQYKKTYYEANKEQMIEKSKAHYETNKETISEKRKHTREANREKIAEYQKAYYLKKKAEINDSV
jgi:hypothetical protein